ncbi:DinB family protein [uncultured Psychroserpens sp.]|uniref:DinB family protein n=1 Tax=uncultured Psychroserpens sp. TaxID=255436 RepID=UPI002638BC69|nr:DinB family protein [uncultured Psychroserpens sp.]
MKRSITMIFAFICTSFMYSQNQAITKKDLVDSWEIMSAMVVESAKAMPADDFNYSPGEPIRNFANQLNHTTKSNIGLGSMIFGKMPSFKMPNPQNPPQEKKAVVDILEKSFEYFKENIEALSDESLSETISWGRQGSGIKITRLKGILIVFSHLQREHGKTMMYLRAKGIKPPAAGSWKF